MPQRPSFEALFRVSPNAYLLLDPDLVILDANAAYLKLTARSLEEHPAASAASFVACSNCSSFSPASS